MSFKAGQQVMCVKDFSRSKVQKPFGQPPPRYPKMHEELLIVRMHDSHLVFSEYEYVFGQYGPRTSWCPSGFVPIAPMEEAIADLMRVEEPQLA